jgi:hypothetical protein
LSHCPEVHEAIICAGRENVSNTGVCPPGASLRDELLPNVASRQPDRSPRLEGLLCVPVTSYGDDAHCAPVVKRISLF